jgi:uncharacterized protein (TIGR03435 family)
MTPALFSLLNHVWQSTLVVGVAWLACATLLRQNSPRIRYGIWLTASLKFLIPFAALIEAGRWLAPRPLLSPSQSQQAFDIFTAGSGVLATAPFRPAAPPQAATSSGEILLAAAVVVWTLGAVMVFGRWLAYWRTIRVLARDAHLAGHVRGIPVLRSPRMHECRIEPGVWGVWRQAILIPDGIDVRLGERQLQTILDHEWQHARRHDNLVAWLHVIVQSIFWFNPAVWLVGRQLAAERELACDKAVLESNSADDYAEGILSVCRFYCTPSHSQAAGITSANLKARLESIVSNVPSRGLSRARGWALAAVSCVTLAGPVFVGLLTAQAVSARQANSFVGFASSAEKKFEVASIRPNTSGNQGSRLGPPRNGGITIINFPLRGLIAQAFRTNQLMLAGGPEWISTARYDIDAKGPDPSVANPEVWEMMRSLLIERFHLKYHIEDREMTVFALTVGPRGHKLTLGEDGRCAEEIKAGKNCGDILVPPFGTGMYNMPIGALITGIGQRAGRPIIDKTGLTGKYDLNLTWLPPGAKLEDLNLENVPAEFRPQDMSLPEALEQQAGLKLESTRAPMPVLVIDGVSEPDPN